MTKGSHWEVRWGVPFEGLLLWSSLSLPLPRCWLLLLLFSCARLFFVVCCVFEKERRSCVLFACVCVSSVVCVALYAPFYIFFAMREYIAFGRSHGRFDDIMGRLVGPFDL